MYPHAEFQVISFNNLKDIQLDIHDHRKNPGSSLETLDLFYEFWQYANLVTFSTCKYFVQLCRVESCPKVVLVTCFIFSWCLELLKTC